jgi:hypothetical protein
VDLKNKKHALELDMTCLHLEAEHASHHPSHDETLHTKVSTHLVMHTCSPAWQSQSHPDKNTDGESVEAPARAAGWCSLD